MFFYDSIILAIRIKVIVDIKTVGAYYLIQLCFAFNI